MRVEVAMAAAGTSLSEPTTNALRLAADSAPAGTEKPPTRLSGQFPKSDLAARPYSAGTSPAAIRRPMMIGRRFSGISPGAGWLVNARDSDNTCSPCRMIKPS